VGEPSERVRAIRETRQRSTEEWAAVRARLRVGSLVSVTVTDHQPFGVFVDIGEKFLGLIRRPELDPAGAPIAMSEYPGLGSRFQAVIVGLPEDGQEILLSCLLADFSRFGH
jgi:ribosomal protein S1